MSLDVKYREKRSSQLFPMQQLLLWKLFQRQNYFQQLWARRRIYSRFRLCARLVALDFTLDFTPEQNDCSDAVSVSFSCPSPRTRTISLHRDNLASTMRVLKGNGLVLGYCDHASREKRKVRCIRSKHGWIKCWCKRWI